MQPDNSSNIWEVSLNNTTTYSEIGVKIEEGNNDTFGAGIFISEVRNGSPAYHGGVQMGDMLLAVNMCDLLGASREFAAELIRRIDGEIKMKLFRQRLNKDEKVGCVTPDYIKRLKQRKSDNINSNNNKDNQEENKDNRKKNVMTTPKFDPFGTDSDSY